jgi:ABC-2 type transport system ATP-binding protein
VTDVSTLRESAGPTTEPPPAISAHGLMKSYGDVTAVDGVSFDVPSGSVFALLGPNGAGKSTTVRMLTTLTRPDSGTATVAGIDVVTRPDAVRRRIGVVSQKCGADLEATGRENLVLQAAIHGIRDGKARVSALLERFGLSDAAGRQARTYSGGMLRKLDVALALVSSPDVLFLDEPTTGLDPEARADLWAQIEQLVSSGTTILLTTHYLEEADRLAGQVAIVDRGRVVVSGTPDGLKAQLRGDAVTVDVDHPEAARQALTELSGVRDVTLDGHSVRARVDAGATAVPLLLAALDRAVVGVASVTVSRPSLDDVYLRYAGRSFAAAEEGSR